MRSGEGHRGTHPSVVVILVCWGEVLSRQSTYLCCLHLEKSATCYDSIDSRVLHEVLEIHSIPSDPTYHDVV